ncbi:hypothetical protein L3X38_025124 [Prunus dulcis]|uniref:Uncharacterized protein n=1 Tax=Prunus dulcis TaxID=3755 RepID=A0AAD4W1W5_PRUDU|nr:hypothetical protein L3X38_025124 [Prunus dulcis]
MTETAAPSYCFVAVNIAPVYVATPPHSSIAGATIPSHGLVAKIIVPPHGWNCGATLHGSMARTLEQLHTTQWLEPWSNFTRLHGWNCGATSPNRCHNRDQISFPRLRRGCPPRPHCSS